MPIRPRSITSTFPHESRVSMNLWRIYLSLCLLQLSASAFAQEDALVDPESFGEAPSTVLVRDAVSFDGCVTQNYSFYPGWFAGLGGSFSSVKVDQSFGGTANTNVFNSSSVLVATGTAGGPAPPFHDTLTTFAPVAQLGYFRNFAGSEWLWGTKFSYKYLGLTFNDQNVDSPQTGSFTSTTNPPTTTPFTGNASALSSQVSVNHELALMPFLGHAFRHGRFYLGGGPVVFETQTRIYGLSSHADINGDHTNIGGARDQSRQQLLDVGWRLAMWHGVLPASLVLLGRQLRLHGYWQLLA